MAATASRTRRSPRPRPRRSEGEQPGDTEEVAARIRAQTGNDEVAVARLELTDPASVAAFVSARDGALDMLVNHAGLMAIQELTVTNRGHEMQFATNHLGHFALALGLHDALARAGTARIVSVSYFEDCNEAPTIQRLGEAGLGGVAPYALDRDDAQRLREVSLELLAS